MSCYISPWLKHLFSRPEDSSPEWQEAADGHVYCCVFVPGLCRDLPRDVAGAAGSLEAASSILSHDPTDDSEGEANQYPGTQQQEYGGGRQGLGGATPPVDWVNYTPRQEQRSCGNEGQSDQRVGQALF